MAHGFLISLLATAQEAGQQLRAANATSPSHV